MNDLSQIAELSTISDAEASQLISDRTHADLIAAITSTPRSSPETARRNARRIGMRAPITRRWLIATPVVLGVAGAMLIAGLVARPGEHVGPINVGPGNAKAALTFAKHGHYIDVIVNNPYADQKKYDAEFKAHGLDIKLDLVAASPSVVDKVVFFGGTGNWTKLKVINSKRRCHHGGGGPCPIGIGFRVPLNFHGHARLAFGRPAKTGERYEASVSPFAPGEALHGLRIIGHRLGAVLAQLRTRHVTVAEYHTLVHHNREIVIHNAPKNWFVYDASSWSKGKVMLEVGKTRHQPVLAPAPGTPVPTPSPTGRDH
ncbi:MAG TPA: hypothetical protein VFI65_06800 [Streptosporangiaceae bacterium]|nr:hypothetical protein [Streptosporangiaceae bacterium]